MGPFVSSEHPLIKSGKVKDMPLALFNQGICQPLHTYATSQPPGHTTTFIVVPTVTDLLHQIPIFPQPPYGQDVQTLFRQAATGCSVHFVPNPVQLFVNDALMAITTNDVLFDLGAEEISR
jgi:DNA polymerase alpha subunit B